MTTAYESGRVPEISIRHRLRIAREEAGMEQAELAEAIGVSRTTVSNAEKGRVDPRKITINAWALATGVPATWLETGKTPPSTGGPDDGGENVRPKGFEPLTFCSARATSSTSNVSPLLPGVISSPHAA